MELIGGAGVTTEEKIITSCLIGKLIAELVFVSNNFVEAR